SVRWEPLTLHLAVRPPIALPLAVPALPHRILALCPAPEGPPLDVQEVGLPNKCRVISRRLQHIIDLILDLQNPRGAPINEQPENEPDYCTESNGTENDPKDIPSMRPVSCRQRRRNCSEPHKLE